MNLIIPERLGKKFCLEYEVKSLKKLITQLLKLIISEDCLGGYVIYFLIFR